MKIAVVGVGAMGSVYAGLLGAAGNEVWAVDVDAEHIEAISKKGLRVEGASGDRTVAIRATTDSSAVGVVDLAVLATKAMDVRAAAESMRPLLGKDTVVLSIQNGLGGPETAAEILGEAVAVGVVGGFGASIVASAHVHHHGLELLGLGELSGPVTPRIERVADVWRDAGFNIATYDNIQERIWEKLICNVCFSGTSAVLELTIGEILDRPNAWAVASACAEEAYAVARAKRIPLDFDDASAYTREFGRTIAGARPSMLLDLLAGRRTEADYINGAIVRIAAELGLSAPVNSTVTSLVKAREAATLQAR